MLCYLVNEYRMYEYKSRNEGTEQKDERQQIQYTTRGVLMCNITAGSSVILNICCFVRTTIVSSYNADFGLSLKSALKWFCVLGLGPKKVLALALKIFHVLGLDLGRWVLGLVHKVLDNKGPPTNLVVTLITLKVETFAYNSAKTARSLPQSFCHNTLALQTDRTDDRQTTHDDNSRTLQRYCNVRLKLLHNWQRIIYN